MLSFLLAIIVADPFDRLLQVGGFDKAAWEFNSVIMEWPRSWLSYEASSRNATRDVSASGLSSEAPTELERRKLADKASVPFRKAFEYKFGRKSDYTAGTLSTSRSEINTNESALTWGVYLIFAYDYM